MLTLSYRREFYQEGLPQSLDQAQGTAQADRIITQQQSQPASRSGSLRPPVVLS